MQYLGPQEPILCIWGLSNVKEINIQPEKRQEIINDLREVL